MPTNSNEFCFGFPSKIIRRRSSSLFKNCVKKRNNAGVAMFNIVWGTYMKRKSNLIAALAVTLASAGAANAVTFTVDTTAGTWENTVLTNGGNAGGESTNEIRWGRPATDAGQSGYDYTAAAATSSQTDELFILGTFNHLNFPVFSPSLVSADLAISLSGNADGVGFSFNSTFSFDHFETPNEANPCAAGGVPLCPDLVTLLNPQDTSQVVTVDGTDYTLEIAGFVTDATDFTSFLDSFLTLENQENEAFLVARFSEPLVSEVPLPAAGWMLLAGLGGMAAMRRSRKIK